MPSTAPRIGAIQGATLMVSENWKEKSLNQFQNLFRRDGSDEGKLNKKWFSMPDLDEKKKRAMEREEEEAREGF